MKLALEVMGASYEERDITMDQGFKSELRARMGGTFLPPLPAVFLGEDYIGSHEEIQELCDQGELIPMLEEAGVAVGLGVGENSGSAAVQVQWVICWVCNGRWVLSHPRMPACSLIGPCGVYK